MLRSFTGEFVKMLLSVLKGMCSSFWISLILFYDYRFVFGQMRVGPKILRY